MWKIGPNIPAMASAPFAPSCITPNSSDSSSKTGAVDPGFQIADFEFRMGEERLINVMTSEAGDGTSQI
jgi:hypothetical protein